MFTSPMKVLCMIHAALVKHKCHSCVREFFFIVIYVLHKIEYILLMGNYKCKKYFLFIHIFYFINFIKNIFYLMGIYNRKNISLGNISIVLIYLENF